MKIKHVILFFVPLCIVCISCKQKNEVYLFSYFKNKGTDGLHLAYSYDGFNWETLKNDESFLTPTVSKDKLMRDPCIIKGSDNLYHMVWTVSWNDNGIGYANSTDLINWSEQKFIPVMEHEPSARNCWAPEIMFDETANEYIIYWATSIPGRFPEGDSTSESGYNHRMYYVSTKDFKEFSETKLLYDQGFSVIDAVIRKYDNTYYMFLKDETRYPSPEKNLRIATSKHLTHSYSKPSEPISMPGVWVEGPTIQKIKEEYIIYFDMYRDHRMGAIRSRDLKNWENISDSISFPSGTRHGSVFTTTEETLQKLLAL